MKIIVVKQIFGLNYSISKGKLQQFLTYSQVILLKNQIILKIYLMIKIPIFKFKIKIK